MIRIRLPGAPALPESAKEMVSQPLNSTGAIKPHYCRKCHARMFDAYLDGTSAVAIKCRHCGEMNEVSAVQVESTATGWRLKPDGQGGFER